MTYVNFSASWSLEPTWGPAEIYEELARLAWHEKRYADHARWKRSAEICKAATNVKRRRR